MVNQMDILHPLLMEIYDWLLMINKHKLIMSYNEEHLNEVLKYDIKKRYKSWLIEDHPILLPCMSIKIDENKMIQLIDQYELLCQPQCVSSYGNTALMRACS